MQLNVCSSKCPAEATNIAILEWKPTIQTTVQRCTWNPVIVIFVMIIGTHRIKTYIESDPHGRVFHRQIVVLQCCRCLFYTHPATPHDPHLARVKLQTDIYKWHLFSFLCAPFSQLCVNHASPPAACLACQTPMWGFGICRSLSPQVKSTYIPPYEETLVNVKGVKMTPPGE